MTTPLIALQRFAAALALGAGLGFYYGFLRPLRPRHTHLSDLLFLLGAGWAWLYLSFAVCQGDLRLSYTAGLMVGGLVWEMTLGRFLRPVFSGFWQLISGFFGFFTRPVKIFYKKAAKKAKFLLLTKKKTSRIKGE